jgi:hypothetical protein
MRSKQKLVGCGACPRPVLWPVIVRAATRAAPYFPR